MFDHLLYQSKLCTFPHNFTDWSFLQTDERSKYVCILSGISRYFVSFDLRHDTHSVEYSNIFFTETYISVDRIWRSLNWLIFYLLCERSEWELQLGLLMFNELRSWHAITWSFSITQIHNVYWPHKAHKPVDVQSNHILINSLVDAVFYWKLLKITNTIESIK